MSRHLLSILLLALLTGCAVHQPRITGHPVTMPTDYVEAADRQAAPEVGQWWRDFGDERLNGFMREVFQQNLDLSQAYARLTQLAASSRIAEAGLKPSVAVDGAGGRRRQGGPLGAETTDTYRLSLAASYEIDLWKKFSSRAEAARLEALASMENVKTLYLTLSAQLVDLYYLAVEQRAQLELSDQTIAAFTETLAQVESRYREGLVPALDVYQSRQNLAGARAQRPVFAANLAVAEHALSILLARFPERDLTAGLADLPAPTLDLPVGIPAQLLKRRPDIKAALLQLRASDEQVAAAIADRFPSFSLTGSYGGTSAALGNLLSSGNIFWNMLLNLAQPVLDGGRRKAEVDRTQAVFRENLAAYHQTVLTAMQEVEDALANGKARVERIAMLEDRVEATAGALRLATERYLQGLSDYLPVLTAQGLHFEAQSALLSARRQLIADRIQLARALGGSWMEPLVEKRLAEHLPRDHGL